MFDITLTLLNQFVELIPFFIGLWVIFDMTGSLLFDRR